MSPNRFAARTDRKMARIASAATVLLLILGCSDLGQEPEETPTIQVPSSVDFGAVSVGDMGDTAVVISNRGTLDLVIYSLDLSGQDTGDFEILTPLDSVVLTGGKDISLTLRFEPDSLGVKSATLTVASNDPDAGSTTIDLLGRGVNPAATVSFSNDIQPIFNNNCAFAGCHVSGHSTELNLTEENSYSLLVNVTSKGYSPALRVKPFDAENSVLWNKVEGTGVYGDQMPLGASPLQDGEIGLIETWIGEGAQNN